MFVEHFDAASARALNGVKPMRKLVRHAGLDEAFARRLSIACRVGHASQQSIQCAPWDGTRCDLVVASAHDAYGRKVMDIARRRGTPILRIHTDGASAASRELEDLAPTLALDAGTSVIAEALLALLDTRAPRSAEERRPSHRAMPIDEALVSTHLEASSLLGRLCQGEQSQAGPLKAENSGIAIAIDRDGGRVCAESTQMRMLAASRASRPGWQLLDMGAHERSALATAGCSSLDCFLVTATLAARADLPDLPAGRYRLLQWPDLGGLPDAVDILKVVRLIQSRPLSPAQVAEAAGVEPEVVRACLWAFRCAGLLSEPQDGLAQNGGTANQMQVTNASASAGMLARIARWVGLRARSEDVGPLGGRP